MTDEHGNRDPSNGKGPVNGRESGAPEGDADVHLARWLLLGILAVALLLRLRGLATFPLEGDEIYTFIEASELFATQLEPGIETRPLFYLLQHALFWVAPDRNPVTLRLLPLVFGVAGVWATWKLARSVSGVMAATVSGLMVAISPWHLYASGMARYWSLVYLLACLAFWRLLVAHRSDEVRDYVYALVPCVAGALAHPTFLFPLLGFALTFHLAPAEKAGRWWRRPTSAALKGLWLPLAAAIVLKGVIVLGLTSAGGSIQERTARAIPAIVRLLPAVVQWMTPVVFTAGLLGALTSCLWPAGKTSLRTWGRVSIGGMVSAAVLLFATAFRTPVYADYAISALPLFMVGTGVLVSRAGRRARGGNPVIGVAGTLVIAAGVAPSTISHLSDGMRFDFRPAFETIRTEEPSRPVFINDQYAIQMKWYAPNLDRRAMEVGGEPGPPAIPDGGAWVTLGVRRYGIPGDSNDEFRRWLSERCRLVEAWEGFRLDFRQYRVELQQCEPTR